MPTTARHSRDSSAPAAEYAPTSESTDDSTPRHASRGLRGTPGLVTRSRACAGLVAAVGVVAPVASATAASAATTASTASPTAGQSTATVTVRAGDTLSAIAARTGTTTAALVSANHLTNPNRLYVGQVLTTPTTASAPLASPPAVSVGSSTPTAGPATAASTPTAGTWTVRSGDTLGAIAARTGTTVAALAKLNSLASPNRLRVGQVLQLSAGASAPVTTPKSAPVTTPVSTNTQAIVHNAVATTTTGPAPTTPAANPTPAPTPATTTKGVASSFAGRTYASSTTSAANADAAALAAASVPSKDAMRQLVATTAVSMGLDPALAQAIAYQESGFNMRAVSPADAIGVMQVIPSSGQWASTLVGRQLDLRNPTDNVVAGVAILRALVRSAPDTPTAIAGYYQGLAGVLANGMYADTQRYVASVQSLMVRYS